MARRRFGIFGRGPREGDGELESEPPSDGDEGGAEPVAEAEEPVADAEEPVAEAPSADPGEQPAADVEQAGDAASSGA